MPLNQTTCPIGFLYSVSLPADFNLTQVSESFELRSSLASSVVFSLVLLAGSVLLLLAGARLVKPTLFVSAFGSAFFASLVVVREALAAAPLLSEVASCAVLGAVPLIVGLLSGLLALCCLKVGFALLGAALGSGAGYTLYSLGLSAVPSPALASHHDVVLLACLILGALVGAVLLLRYQKDLLIVATSGAGAAGATPAIFLLLAHANAEFVTKADDVTSPFGWAQPVCTLVLFAIGVSVQCRAGKKSKAPRNERSTPLMQP